MSEIKVNSVVNSTGDNDSGLDLSTNDVVAVKTANTEKMRIDANGNVYYSGAIEFTGNIANGTVSISADNNVTPPTSNAVMKYVVRKWKS